MSVLSILTEYLAPGTGDQITLGKDAPGLNYLESFLIDYTGKSVFAVESDPSQSGKFFEADSSTIVIKGKKNILDFKFTLENGDEITLYQYPEVIVQVVLSESSSGQIALKIECTPGSLDFRNNFPSLPPYPKFGIDENTFEFNNEVTFLESFFWDLSDIIVAPKLIFSTAKYYDEGAGQMIERGFNLLANVQLQDNAFPWPLSQFSPLLPAGVDALAFHAWIDRTSDLDPPRLIAQLRFRNNDKSHFLNNILDEISIRLISNLYPEEAGLNPDEAGPVLSQAGMELLGLKRIRNGPELHLKAAAPVGYEQMLILSCEVDNGQFPGFADLAHILGLDITDHYPDQLKRIPGLAFRSASIIFTLKGQSDFPAPEVSMVECIIGTTQSCPLVEHFLEVEDLLLAISISSPFDENNRMISLLVHGKIAFAEGILNIEAQKVIYPDTSNDIGNDTGLHILGRVEPDHPIKLLKVLDEFGLDTSNFPLESEISNLQFEADTKTKAFSFFIELGVNWNFLGSLTLKEIFFSIQNHGVAQDDITASMGCRISFANSEEDPEDEGNIALSATCLPGDAGWQLEGSAENIEFQNLVAEIEDLFKITVPNIFQAPTLKSLDISFNTKTHNFTFACTGVLGNEVEATVYIDIQRQDTSDSGSHYEKQFSGHLAIPVEDGKFLHFNLGYKSEGYSILLADFNNPDSWSVSIDSLLGKFFNLSTETGLSFSLNNALLARYREENVSADGSSTAASDPKWLFGLDIEGGINLSNIELPDLPLIGAIHPPEETLHLGFQLLVASAAFSKEDIEKVNDFYEGGMLLPQKGIDDFSLSTTLRIGEERKQLDLPIGVNTNGDASGNGLGSTAPSDDGSPGSTPNVAAPSTSTASATASDGTQWIKIQKTFGPVHIERVGLNYKAGKVTGLIDADLSVGGLTISLDGLSVSSPLDHLAPEFSLQGLGIDYKNGPLEIGGAFLKHRFGEGDDAYTAFSGLAVISTEKLSLSAVGSFAVINDRPSMFIYATLDYPLGGPSFFFVTGLAAGFGYNRNLLVPEIGDVSEFPLVKEARNSTGPSLPTGSEDRQNLLTSKLEALEAHIPPSIGDHFLAIGIKYTSFKQIDSFALLIVKFGHRLEIDLLGVSNLVVPAVPGNTSPLAKAEMVLRASYIPDEGILRVQAQISPGSYILSQKCHLGGGFAFYSWFKDQPDTGVKAGDFVLSLGGYHPDFHKPAHYPEVPRLSMNWQVNRDLSIKGRSYYALCAHALMAGGLLEASYHTDNLRVWIQVGADFLITWQPYHYDARAFANVQADAIIHFFGTHHLHFEAHANLHLYGPDFGMDAHVDVKVFGFKVSVDVHVGAEPASLEPIAWSAFKEEFLPPSEQICSVAVQGGLIRQMEEADGQKRWIVNPKELVLATNSVIPITEAKLEEINIELEAGVITNVGIAPMGIAYLDKDMDYSRHKITLKYNGQPVLLREYFKLEPVLKAVPAALWGEGRLENGLLKKPSLNGERLLENRLAGFELRPANPPTAGESHTIDKEMLRYETELLSGAFNWQNGAAANAGQPLNWANWRNVQETISQEATRNARRTVLDDLGFVDPDIHFGESIVESVLGI
jgi:hypothetical protein